MMSIEEFNAAQNPPFKIFAPAEQRVPFVFNSPHSGRVYPQSLVDASCLSAHGLRTSEDVFIDQLFSSAVEIGAPLLTAQFPRAWLDVNREPYELDRQLFAEPLPAYANSHSMRVNAGLGTIPRLVAENMPIYHTPPRLAEGLDRINAIYRPYHTALSQLIARSAVTFGHAVLVDCHSMPSKSFGNRQFQRSDIIIGDRYGTACNSRISLELMRRFTDQGYSVTRNKPYAGGFITEHYGRPAKGLHAVQIEINRSLYVDEKTLEPTAHFEQLKHDIRTVLSHVVSLPDEGFTSSALAAE